MNLPSGVLEPEEEYDLDQAINLLHPPYLKIKIVGRRAVGCAIRFLKAIKETKLANDLYKLVEHCFIPHAHADPKDRLRVRYGLFVQPSIGGIQCVCFRATINP